MQIYNAHAQSSMLESEAQSSGGQMGCVNDIDIEMEYEMGF